MNNFTLLDGTTIQLPSGVFAGIERFDVYNTGELAGIRLSEKNMLLTHAGELVPAHTETHRRKIKYSVAFYKNGMIKAVALEEMQEIQTPVGEFPAELVTFYDSGELCRVFPLDGKISGMNSEEDEKALAIPLSFELPFTTFTAIISGLAFYKSGNIRSITLFPGEVITIATIYGEVPVRNGFSMYESGKLKSIEPDQSVGITTPIGLISAFHPDAVGINADSNSLVFDAQGRVISLITVHTRIAAQTPDGRLLMFSPREIVNPLDDETMITDGLKISFDYKADTVVFTDSGKEYVLPVADSGFTVAAYNASTALYNSYLYGCTSADCASCISHCLSPTLK